MIDLEKCSESPQLLGGESCKHESDSFFQIGGWQGFFRTVMQRMIEWYITKWLIAGILTVVTVFFTAPRLEHKIDAISSAFASGGYFSAFSELFMGTSIESDTMNSHAVYVSKGIKEIELEKGIKFKKAFWLVTYEGKKFLLMRKPLRNSKGELIKADQSNFIFEDADSICSGYGGSLPTKDMVVKSAKILNRIKRPKGTEMFADSDKAVGYFRCVVDPTDFEEAK
jgi:hypothetical protein